MKNCTKCKTPKELKCFNKNKTKKDGYNNICRECSNKNSKNYYNHNKEEHVNNVRVRNKKIILENRKKYFEILKNSSCAKCPESHIFSLEFDHRDTKTKLGSINSLINSGYKWEIIEKEMAKCDLVCANCHRKRTGLQQGWYKDLL